jgi:cytochrome P450
MQLDDGSKLFAGNIFRCQPNCVIVNSPTGQRSIYGYKANVKKGKFYEVWARNSMHKNTLSTVDKDVHAQKRRILSSGFSEKALRSSESFITKNVDRWCELLFQGKNCKEWTQPMNMSDLADGLVFDMMGEMCFGKSFDAKEPGDNPFKAIPHTIAKHLQFMYPVSEARP